MGMIYEAGTAEAALRAAHAAFDTQSGQAVDTAQQLQCIERLREVGLIRMQFIDLYEAEVLFLKALDYAQRLNLPVQEPGGIVQCLANLNLSRAPFYQYHGRLLYEAALVCWKQRCDSGTARFECPPAIALKLARLRDVPPVMLDNIQALQS